jgi:hypothetical protein
MNLPRQESEILVEGKGKGNRAKVIDLFMFMLNHFNLSCGVVCGVCVSVSGACTLLLCLFGRSGALYATDGGCRLLLLLAATVCLSLSSSAQEHTHTHHFLLCSVLSVCVPMLLVTMAGTRKERSDWSC